MEWPEECIMFCSLRLLFAIIILLLTFSLSLHVFDCLCVSACVFLCASACVFLCVRVLYLWVRVFSSVGYVSVCVCEGCVRVCFELFSFSLCVHIYVYS